MDFDGRFGACPCGSGRRHQDCCGSPERARGGAPTPASTRESSLTKLLSFAFQPLFDGDHSAAENIFWGPLLRAGAPDQVQWLIESEDATIKYNAWFLFDWDVDGDGTVAQLFLDGEEAGVTREERKFLERLAAAHLRLYEVEAVRRGEGVQLLDLWTGGRFFVIERTASLQMASWDLLGARVAPDGGGGYVFEGGLYLFPADVRPPVLSRFRRLHRRHLRKFPGDDSAAFFRKHGVVFNHLWMELVAFPDPPSLETAEGDPLMFCRSVFDTVHVDALRSEIAARPDVLPAADGRLCVTERTGEAVRELGRLDFEGQRLVFESTSQERAARGRAWLEALAGERVRYRATAIETVEQTMMELRRRPKGAAEQAPQVETGAVRELYDRQYRTWLDRPDPGLGNRTPRAAARTKLWRAHVVERLKTLENGVERSALDGRPPYDLQWIWKELGLERPGPRPGL
jgi:hypothetical protein